MFGREVTKQQPTLRVIAHFFCGCSGSYVAAKVSALRLLKKLFNKTITDPEPSLNDNTHLNTIPMKQCCSFGVIIQSIFRCRHSHSLPQTHKKMATKPHLIDTLPSSSLQTFIDAFRQVDLTSPKSIYDTYVHVGGTFKWDDAVTPLSSLQSIGLTLVLYVVISYTISFILGTKTPKEMEEEHKNPTFFQKVLKWVAFLHNLNMTVISLVCFFGLLFEVAKIGLKDGFYSLLCDPEHKYNVGYIPFWTYMVSVLTIIDFQFFRFLFGKCV